MKSRFTTTVFVLKQLLFFKCETDTDTLSVGLPLTLWLQIWKIIRNNMNHYQDRALWIN